MNYRKCFFFANILHPLSLYFHFYAGDVKYTFSNDIREVYTFLDNILISQLCASNGRFVTANIIDDVNNFSDHLAFCCSLGFENDVEVLLSNNTIDGNKYFYKYNWSIDAQQKYYA